MRTYNGQKHCNNEMCGKGFIEVNGLKIHMIKYAGKRAFTIELYRKSVEQEM